MVIRTLDVVDGMLSRGQFAATTGEAADLLGVPADQVRVRMSRLTRAGRVFSPARGLWVAVPPEFRSWGVLPGTHFLDPMMSHLGRDYYVGWLSAAELYGAAHQRPQVLQVAVDRHVPDRDLGRVRLRFGVRSHLLDLPRERHTVPTGQVWVSTPEVTALDLAATPRLGGGVSNIATVLLELEDEGRLRSAELTQAAEHYSLATVRRLGYLLETVGLGTHAEALHPLTAERRVFPADDLSPGDGRHGAVEARWRLRVNAPVEPDV